MSAAENKKRNIWVIGVLVVVVGVFALFAVSPIFTAFSGDNPDVANSTGNPANPALDPEGLADPAAELEALEARAQGYEAVLEREPDNRNALEGLLEIRLQQGDLENAIVPLEALADLSPEQTRYRLALAQAKGQLGDLGGAEAAYRTLLEGDPAELLALQGLVTLLVQQGRPEEAVSEIENTLAVASELNAGETEVIPEKPVRFLLAQVYSTVGRWDEAIAIYDAAIAEDSSDFRPTLGKAIALFEQGNPEAAKPLFKQAYESAPANFQQQIAQMGNSLGFEITPPPAAQPAPAIVPAEPEVAPAEPAPAE